MINELLMYLLYLVSLFKNHVCMSRLSRDSYLFKKTVLKVYIINHVEAYWAGVNQIVECKVGVNITIMAEGLSSPRILFSRLLFPRLLLTRFLFPRLLFPWLLFTSRTFVLWTFVPRGLLFPRWLLYPERLLFREGLLFHIGLLFYSELLFPKPALDYKPLWNTNRT